MDMAWQTSEQNLIWRRMHISLHDVIAYVGDSPEYIKAVKALASGRDSNSPLVLKDDPSVKVPSRILTPYAVLCITQKQLTGLSRISQDRGHNTGARVWMSGILLCFAWPDDTAPTYLDQQGRQV